MKKFENYIDEWEQNAKKDAYWAVLTTSQNEEVEWDRTQFFQTGIHEIRTLKDYSTSIGLPIPFQGRALDFGCGVGRLSQALAKQFDSVCGLDISENMVRQAKEALQDAQANIEYVHNPHPDLRLLQAESFDFIYSNIVLQHIGKVHQLNYLREFARVTKPGGWIIVQVPSQRIYASFLRKIKGTIAARLPYRWNKWIQVELLKNRSKALADFDFEINLCSVDMMQTLASEKQLEIKHIAYTNSCEADFGGNLIFSSYEQAVQRPGFLSPMYFMQKKGVG